MITLRTKVNNGKLPTTISNDIKAFISSHEGKYVEIILKKARSKRSDPQNRYYWGAVVPIVCDALKDLGHRLNKEETHEFLKMKFNYKSVCNAQGELIGDIPQSTTTLTKSEFCDYVDKIVQWCAEYLNVVIPDPSTQLELIN